MEGGESLKQMADLKYALDDNVKQNFLEPLHHLQTKDLKEVRIELKLNKVFLSQGKVLIQYLKKPISQEG